MSPRPTIPAAIAAAGLVLLLLGIVPHWWFGASFKLDFMDDGKEVRFDFGLTSVKACGDGRCGEMEYSGIPEPKPSEYDDYDDDNDDEQREIAEFKKFKRFVWAGRVTYWGGVITAIAIAGALLMWLMRQRLPVSPGTVGGALAILVAVTATVAFMMKVALPDMGMERLTLDLKMGVGYPLTLLGTIGCAIGGFLLAQEEKRLPMVGSHPPGYVATAPPGFPQPGGPSTPAPYDQSAFQPPGRVAARPPAPTLSPACPRCNAPTIFVSEHQRHFCSSCRAYL